MKRNIWVVGAFLAAAVGLSSCAATEKWLYGDSQNSREDMVQRDRTSSSRDDQNSRGRYADNDGGTLFSRRNRDDHL